MIPTAMIPTAMTLAAMTLSRLDAAAARLLDVLWRGSWQAAVLAGLVLAAQLALRSRLSARWRYKLWAVVILRLLIPVTPASPLSVFNLSRSFRAAGIAPAMATIPAAPPASSGAGDLGGVPSAAPLAQVDAAKPQAASRTIATIPPPLLRRWYLVIASAWFFGMLALLARVALATWRLSRGCRASKMRVSWNCSAAAAPSWTSAARLSCAARRTSPPPRSPVSSARASCCRPTF